MKANKKDIFMYILYFAVIIMFIFLFIIFFRTGKYETTNHTAQIAENITTVTLKSNYSNINVYPSDTGAAYIKYQQRKSNESSDEVFITSLNNAMTINVKRRQGNALSGLWKNTSALNIYLPDTNNIALNFEITSGTINVENATLHLINCKSTAGYIKIVKSALDRLVFQSTVGRLVTDSSKITSANIKVNIGDFEFLHQSSNSGFTLDNNISAGLIFSDKSMNLAHPNLAVKYTEKIAAYNGSNKITLTNNVGIIKITE